MLNQTKNGIYDEVAGAQALLGYKYVSVVRSLSCDVQALTLCNSIFCAECTMRAAAR
jgi:hypothetical protein